LTFYPLSANLTFNVTLAEMKDITMDTYIKRHAEEVLKKVIKTLNGAAAA
jgi:hypothetical protein